MPTRLLDRLAEFAVSRGQDFLHRDLFVAVNRMPRSEQCGRTSEHALPAHHSTTLRTPASSRHVSILSKRRGILSFGHESPNSRCTHCVASDSAHLPRTTSIRDAM